MENTTTLPTSVIYRDDHKALVRALTAAARLVLVARAPETTFPAIWAGDYLVADLLDVEFLTAPVAR